MKSICQNAMIKLNEEEFLIINEENEENIMNKI